MSEDRGAAMAASLVRTTRQFGVDPRGVTLLNTAHALAMAPRVATLGNQRDPAYLHPGHTALVLLRDAGVKDALVLAAAALTETEDEELRVSQEDIRTQVDEHVADLVAAVPLPGREDLLEALVAAPEEVRLIAVAERLDHARHAHLKEETPQWRRALHEECLAVYLPVAERTHPKLATRFRHWGRAFAKRLERER